MPEIQPWVVAGRIAAILGMGLSISLGILLLLMPEWLWGTLAFAMTAPFLALMIAVERSKAAQSMTGKPPAS
jgi:hypothetical protein